jgi:hypothetical protein
MRLAMATADPRAASAWLSPDQLAALDAVSQGEQRMLYSLFTLALRKHVVFGAAVSRALDRFGRM